MKTRNEHYTTLELETLEPGMNLKIEIQNDLSQIRFEKIEDDTDIVEDDFYIDIDHRRLIAIRDFIEEVIVDEKLKP